MLRFLAALAFGTLSLSAAFVVLSPTGPRRFSSRTSCCMVSGTGAVREDVAVIGVAGGTAETVCFKLLEQGNKVVAILDRPPVSPLLQAAAKDKSGQIKLVYGLADGSVLASKTVVVIGDEGDDDLRGNIEADVKVLGGDNKAIDRQAAARLLDQTLLVLPPSIKSLLCVASAASTSGKTSTLDIKNPFTAILKAGGVAQDGLAKYAAWCNENKRPFSTLRYGLLTGGVSGAEPLPFMGLPAVDAELHPSYTLQSVVLTSLENNQYADTEMCTRESLAEAIVCKVSKPQQPINALVISIEGQPPSERDWEALFQRMQVGSNVELLSVAFGEIKKPAALSTWLVDQWFPQALIDADAATILTGARPVRAQKVSESVVQIKWEELQPDLSVRPAGALEIRIDAAKATLSVVRASGGGAGASLPGEMQLVDRLLEGINKNVYKRGFASAPSV